MSGVQVPPPLPQSKIKELAFPNYKRALTRLRSPYRWLGTKEGQLTAWIVLSTVLRATDRYRLFREKLEIKIKAKIDADIRINFVCLVLFDQLSCETFFERLE